MVRLKVRKPLEFVRQILFQFQYGSIKRIALKHLQTQQNCFNSSMVRLKEPVPKINLSGQWRFNSSMVRLKDADNETGEGRLKAFQFQYGSIKSKVTVNG